MGLPVAQLLQGSPATPDQWPGSCKGSQPRVEERGAIGAGARSEPSRWCLHLVSARRIVLVRGVGDVWPLAGEQL